MSLPWSNSELKQSNGGMMNPDDIKSRLAKFRQQIPDETQDEYYADTASRLDTIIGGDTQHFLRLQRVKNEWDDLARAVPVGQGFLTFDDYVREYYGVKLVYDGDNVSLAYSVIDEKKYVMFVLKFNR
jgi:uncharacterized protein YutD